MYTLSFAPQALEDLARLKKFEPAAFKKAGKLLYEIEEDVVKVAVLSSYGHYDNK